MSNTSYPAGPKGEKRTQFERIVLLLQGGGALGSYQGGVYQALAEANLHPDWVAGISIGAINAALIAGNPPDKRVDRLREFWESVSTPPLGIPYFDSIEFQNRSSLAALEIAEFIKNTVVRQKHFVIDSDNPSVLNDCRRVEDVVLTVDKTDDGRNAARLLC